MASRYVKIPVVQPIYTESGSSYSKVLKTLRVPQEYLSLNTGSLYFSGKVFNSGDPQVNNDLISEITEMFQVSEEAFFGAEIGGARKTQYGLWMQIPLNISKVLWEDPEATDPKGQPVSDDEKYPDFNGSLWLLISQEVSFPQGGTSGKGNGLPQVQYIYPFASNLFKTNNSQYINKLQSGKLALGDKDVFGVQRYLQERLEKCFVSNPGATETLLDFGHVPAQEAGLYNNDNLTSPIPVVGSQFLPEEGMAKYWNAKSRLIVTCAVVTNQGMGVNQTEVKDAIQSYPAMGELWGLDDNWYDSTLIGQTTNSNAPLGFNPQTGQELSLNPATIFTAGTQLWEQFVGDIKRNGKTISEYCCESWSNGPIKGKGGPGPEEVEALMEEAA